MKAHLWPSVCTTMNMVATTRRTIKIKTGNQADRFAITIIDNNKTSVRHLAIPREVSHLLCYGATGSTSEKDFAVENKNCSFE